MPVVVERLVAAPFGNGNVDARDRLSEPVDEADAQLLARLEWEIDRLQARLEVDLLLHRHPARGDDGDRQRSARERRQSVDAVSVGPHLLAAPLPVRVLTPDDDRSGDRLAFRVGDRPG